MGCKVRVVHTPDNRSRVSISRSYDETGAQNSGNGTDYATANVVDFSNGTTNIQDFATIASNEITILVGGNYLIEFNANIKDGGTGNTRYVTFIGDGTSNLMEVRSDVVNNRNNTVKNQLMVSLSENDIIDFRMRSFDAVENGTLAGFSIVIIPV